MLELGVVPTGLLIFFARIFDVSIGTIRTVVTVQGRIVAAFVPALFEITFVNHGCRHRDYPDRETG